MSKRRITTFIILTFVLRLAYLGALDLIPEEAYYWLYSKHLAPGYLDHPPVVAWLIWLGTEIFGQNAFGVRVGALVCWCFSAVFVFRLTQRLTSRVAAPFALLLFSILPFFVGAGTTIAPDAGLVLGWSGALYFLARALLDEQPKSWYGVGAFVGLGLLSKYTIVLLGPATLIFCLFRAPARKWFFRREPYLAALLALAIFTPVLYWNARNGWASFVFQGPTRLAKPAEFALHLFLLDVFFLLTPVGFAGLVLWLGNLWRLGHSARPIAEVRFSKISFSKQEFFSLCFIFVPLAVFALYSLRHETKLNWSGPIFLALLPWLAEQIQGGVQRSNPSPLRAWLFGVVKRGWQPTCVILIAAYWLALHFLAFGIPYVPYAKNMQHFVGWKSLGGEAARLVDEQERLLGAQPIVAGMDKHYVASELSFYLPQAKDYTVIGRSRFDRSALMFHFWDRDVALAGKNLVLIARGASDLDAEMLKPYFDKLSPLGELHTQRGGKQLGTFYYRVGEKFRG